MTLVTIKHIPQIAVIAQNNIREFLTEKNNIQVSHIFMQNVTGVTGGTVIDKQYTYNAGLGAAVAAESREAAN